MTLGASLLGLGHQTADAGELLDLVLRTTGAGVEHHEHGVEALVGLGHLLHQDVADVVVHVRPGVDDLVVALVVGNEAHVVVVGNLLHLLVTLADELCLLLGDDDVIEVERQAGQVGHAVTQVLDAVEELAGLGEAHVLDDVGNDVAQRLLRDDLVHEAHLVRDDAVDDDAAHGGLHLVAHLVPVNDVVDDDLHLSVQVALALVVCDDGLLGAVERESLALGSRAYLSDIV